MQVNTLVILHTYIVTHFLHNIIFLSTPSRNTIFQISLKAEMEVAMKLLEKDIHDKQDTIISLRRQLDDIKLINLEMYKKLQVSVHDIIYSSFICRILYPYIVEVIGQTHRLEYFQIIS